jgi:hypothetical protein
MILLIIFKYLSLKDIEELLEKKLFINDLGCILRDNFLKIFQEITNIEQETRSLGMHEKEIEGRLRKKYSSLSQKVLLDMRERILIK